MKSKKSNPEPGETAPHMLNAESGHQAPIPVIGIGASAGGIEAFEAFFSQMSTTSGLALVVIQHLDPHHDSILAELIQRYTEMPVRQVENDMLVEANRVYVIPPNAMMALFDGRLQLFEPTQGMKLRLPIDFFFRSLADDLHDRAVGIILSGTGSDGTLGLKAIKGEGGLVMVQDPTTTVYDGMPRNAIATGLVDFILPTEALPEQLTKYLKLRTEVQAVPIRRREKSTADLMHQILLLVRLQTGHDFSHYKESTIYRRIERLMAINQIDKLPDYVLFLQNNTLGVEALFRDLLIGVTSFFRDKKVFENLQQQVIPSLFQNRRPDQPIRIWVPGCSTGEEAYSLAILIREHMATLKQEFRVQIFASDIDNQAINNARLGLYPLNIAQDVPAEYLQRYFLATDTGYQVTKSLRELLVFALHSIVKDPPFSKLDLISCRNLLIYLDAELQDRVLSYFHFALTPAGFLLLGSSESLGKHDHDFTTLDLQHKIFRRAPGHPTSQFALKVSALTKDGYEKDGSNVSDAKSSRSLREITQTMLLNDWTPACVIINDQGHIRYVHGRTGKYLEISTGELDKVDIVKSAREGLKLPLTTAIHRAITQQREIYEPGIYVKTNGDKTLINLIVKPLIDTPSNENLLAVFFEEVEAFVLPNAIKENLHPASFDEREQKYLLLQQELTDTKEYLQATIEELKSSNEEMQSMNEELQSVNEELETSQEELKALNEELLTINSELEQKVEELTWANNDLGNTLDNLQIGIVLLDSEFQIRRFNLAATKVFKLISGDIGRLITHVVSDLNSDTLLANVETVFNTLTPRELDFQTKAGQEYTLQIRPYRTRQNAIKGVVLSFTEATTHKPMAALQPTALLGEQILNAIREPLLLLDSDLRVVSANQVFLQAFQVSAEETLGYHLSELGHGQWNLPELVALLYPVFAENSALDDYLVDRDFPIVGRQKLRLNARQIQPLDDQPPLVLLALQAVTTPT